MPQLKFDKTELIEFFSALPEDGEDGTSHSWQLHRCGLILNFAVWPYHSDVIITIKREGSTVHLVDLQLLGSPAITLYREPREFIEIEARQPFRNRYGPNPKVAFGFKLFVEPEFQLEIYQRDL